MSRKPGVMIYFDLLPALRSMSNSDKGALFEAILEYGNCRRELPLSSKAQILWPIIKQRLDRDEMQYVNAVTKRAYAAYIRWAKHNAQEPMDFTSWQESKGYALIDEAYETTTGCFVKGM